MRKLFCKHKLFQDIRFVQTSDISSEAVLHGVYCDKCGKKWDHWTPRLERLYYHKTLIDKLKEVFSR